MSQTFINNSLGQSEETDQLLNAEQLNAEVAVYELIDRLGSGFIREGTERMPEPDEIDVAGTRTILSSSAYRKNTGTQKKPNWKRVPIRYRASSESVDPEEQDKLGHEANPANDKIVFKNGRLVVVKEGLSIGKFEFLRKDSRNETNPDRIPTVPVIYREIFPEKENENSNEDDFALANAISYLQEFITDKSEKKGISYDNYRLGALARLHNIVADSPGGMMKGLLANAKLNPLEFLNKSKEFEIATATEILHGLKLNVLSFENSRVINVPRKSVLLSFETGLQEDQRIKRLAGFFMSEKGAAAYQMFKVDLNDAKEKNV